MEIIFEVSGTTMIAELFGEMDHHSADKVRKSIDDTISNYTAKNLIFDFGRVSFMDSSGIGVILGRYKKIKEQSGTVIIVNCSANIRNILNMAGVFSIVDYIETKEAALEILQRKEVS